MSTKIVYNPKIALLGAGQIGGTLALLASVKKLSSNVVLLDIVDGVAAGKALDLSQAMAAEGITCHVTGSADITENSEALTGSDIVIVTAGFPRKPGMSRDDLLARNAEVITGVAKAIKTRCPNAFVVCITNPLDVMVSLLQKASGLPANRVVGMAGMLDSARYRYFLAQAMGVSPKDVCAMVLGGHGDDMVPVQSITSVNGVSLESCIKMGLITQPKVDEIIKRTRQGGGEIVSLLKMGSAFVAPACCAMQMVEAYLRDEKRVMSCCAQLTGQYGHSGIYAGVPVVIGASGVEKILEVPLSPEETVNMNNSISAVEELRQVCTKLGFTC